MNVQFNAISGCMLGFELVSSNELENDESGLTYLIVDLFILRMLITF